MAVAAAKVSSSASEFPSPAPCTAAALSAPYHEVDSVSSFGCVGAYAYLWATVGTAPAEVSVTELLTFDPTTDAWRNALRAQYCGSGVLPVKIEQRACNSN